MPNHIHKRLAVMLACIVGMSTLAVLQHDARVGAQPALTVAAPAAAAVVAAPLGDYSKIDSLKYSAAPAYLTDRHYVAGRFADVMQMQAYLRTGVDPGPLSSQFLNYVIAENERGVSKQHGWSSPLLGQKYAALTGTCLASECVPPSSPIKLWMGKSTTAQKNSALKYRAGDAFVLFPEIKTYANALAFLRANRGAAFILTNSGRDADAIIGVDPAGLGIWLQATGTAPAKASHKTLADGEAQWKLRLHDQAGGLEPANYLVGLTMR